MSVSILGAEVSQHDISREAEALQSSHDARPAFVDLYPSSVPKRKGRLPRTHHSLLSVAPGDDFLTLVSFISSIYQQNRVSDLLPMQNLRQSNEWFQGEGRTCDVGGRHISLFPSSRRMAHKVERFVCHRTKGSVLNPESGALRSFMAELRVRSHPPLVGQHTISQLTGIAWDFEDEGGQIPRPLWIDLCAQEGSLTQLLDSSKLAQLSLSKKTELLLNISEGLMALHKCGIAHSDFKPDNILIFKDNGTYIAKISDFGFSVFANDDADKLLGYTPPWNAPELTDETTSSSLTFRAMQAADVYSYGLVVLSIVLGCQFWERMKGDVLEQAPVEVTQQVSRNNGEPESEDLMRKMHDSITEELLEHIMELKLNDTIVSRATQLIEAAQQETPALDIDLETTRSILRATLSRECQSRDLEQCFVATCNSHKTSQSSAPDVPNESDAHELLEVLKATWNQPLRPHEFKKKLCIDYQSLADCGFGLQRTIYNELHRLASESIDPRNTEAFWHLCICLFEGFGADRNFEQAHFWLQRAVMAGNNEAQAFFFPLERATNKHSSALIPPRLGEIVELDHVQSAEDVYTSRNASIAFHNSTEHSSNLEQYIKVYDLEQYKKATRDYHRSLKKFPPNNNQARPTTELYDCQDLRADTENAGPAGRALDAAQNGSIERLRAATEKNPHILNVQDMHGNTPLILAVKCGHLKILRFLALHDHVHAGMIDHSQQNVLHFLANYELDDIRAFLIPLIQKGADIFQETVIQHCFRDLSFMELQAPCDPLMNAIIRNNIPFAEALLEAWHDSQVGPCRICAESEVYREMLAMSTCLYRYPAIQVLRGHVQKYNRDKVTNLSAIQVYIQRGWLSLPQIAFRTNMLRRTCLPESCFRALHHGAEFFTALHNTLKIFLENEAGAEKTLNLMLAEAAANNCIDTIDFLLVEASKRGLSPLTQRFKTNLDIDRNPLVSSIRSGFREVFSRLLHSSSDLLLLNPIEVDGSLMANRAQRSKFKPTKLMRFKAMLRGFFTSSSRTRFLNLAHVLLSIAISAAHQDHFFAELILQRAAPALLLQEPSEFDERFSGEPVSFLSQAILTSSYSSARLIIDTYPSLLDQNAVMLPVAARKPGAQNYISPSFSDLFDLDPEFGGAPYTPDPWHWYKPQKIPLIQLILLVGSHKHCVFLLKELCRTRRRSVFDNLAESDQQAVWISHGTVEQGTSEWKRCQLSPQEYHMLLTGLIKNNRQDRKGLWDTIGIQVHYGQSKDVYYLRLAISCANDYAVEKLLECGWSMNGPLPSRIFSPLLLALYCASNSPYYGHEGYSSRAPEGDQYLEELPETRLRADVSQYRETGKKSWHELRLSKTACFEILYDNGASIPKISDWAVDWKKRYLLLLTYFGIYYALLPLTLVYCGSYVGSVGNFHQVLGLSYLWATLCIIAPPLPILFLFPWQMGLPTAIFAMRRVFWPFDHLFIMDIDTFKPNAFRGYMWLKRRTGTLIPWIGWSIATVLFLFNHFALPIVFALAGDGWVDSWSSDDNSTVAKTYVSVFVVLLAEAFLTSIALFMIKW